MGKKFLYVFCESARDTLLAAGFRCLSQDKINNIYAFENSMTFSQKQSFALDSVSYIMADTLTF